MAGPEDRQGPTNGVQATSYDALMDIVCHPAFRLGFLDAQAGKEFDHDDIMRRIVAETNERALGRIGWPWAAADADDALLTLFGTSDLRERARHNRSAAVELAQYRYEEGRIAVLGWGLRCKAWGHPDYPPKAVQDFIWQRAESAKAAA